MFDTTLFILIGLVALSFFSHNTTVAVAVMVLIIIRITPLNAYFPWVEKQGLTLGIVILTIGVMAPIASGSLPPSTLISSFLNWKSLIAIAVGVLSPGWGPWGDTDERAALAGRRASGGNRTGCGPVPGRAGRATDCGRSGFAVNWSAVNAASASV
jgi:hypothetical protein